MTTRYCLIIETDVQPVVTFSRRRIVVRIGPLAVAHLREQLAELASALGQARHLVPESTSEGLAPPPATTRKFCVPLVCQLSST